MIKRLLITGVVSISFMMGAAIAGNVPAKMNEISVGEGLWSGQLKKDGPFYKNLKFNEIGYIVSNPLKPNEFILHHVNGTQKKLQLDDADFARWNDCKPSTLLKPNANHCEFSGVGKYTYLNGEKVLHPIASVGDIVTR